MKIFDGFNQEGPACLFCGTLNQEPTVLIPKAGAGRGRTVKAIQVHLGCLVDAMVYYPDMDVLAGYARQATEASNG